MTKFGREEREPTRFLGRHGGSIKFCLTGRKGNRGGASTTPADGTGAKREEVTLGGAAIGTAVSPRRVTEPKKRGRGHAPKSEAKVGSAAEIAKDSARSSPV